MDDIIIIEHVSPPSDEERIKKLLWEIDDTIIPKLSDRVDMNIYARKLSMYADLFYAKHEGVDIGNCAIYLNNYDCGYISSIVIKKQWQKKGFARKMWLEVLQMAQIKGVQKINLRVNQYNTNAIAFYTKLGFKTENIFDNWINMSYNFKQYSRDVSLKNCKCLICRNKS